VSERALRLGTRGSELALWQARHVAQRIAALPDAPPVEVVVLKTSGDLLSDVPLSQIPGKGIFTAEIERALAAGEIDLAVHSLKDLATEMPDGLTLAAVLSREDPRDALVVRAGRGRSLDDLPRRARVGTSSLRRQAFVRRWRDDLELASLRGNVPTRLRRLDEGRFDAIVLAAAGLERLGLTERISRTLPVDRFAPAVGQGALAVQVRAGDRTARDLVAALDDPAARAATTAERALLHRLGGGCQLPLGALAKVDGGALELAATVCSRDGARALDGSASGSARDAAAIGEHLADELLSRGARELFATFGAERETP
jgi:hydroxymethylbilane synthase